MLVILVSVEVLKTLQNQLIRSILLEFTCTDILDIISTENAIFPLHFFYKKWKLVVFKKNIDQISV